MNRGPTLTLLITAALLYRCASPSPPTTVPPVPLRAMLLTEGQPITLSGETRSAVVLSTRVVEIDIPETVPGSRIRYAVGVEPPVRRATRHRVLHSLELDVPPRAGTPATTRSPARAPRVLGTYTVVVEGTTSTSILLEPGPGEWVETTLEIPRGMRRLRFRLGNVSGAAEGETPWLAVPQLLPPPETNPRTVLLVSVDTLRADHLGSYGHSLPSTPHLDRLSRRATQHSRVHSTSSWTLPAHVGLLFSRFGSEVGARSPLDSVQPEIPSLAEVLGRHGFSTWARTNHLLVSERYGLHRGFEVFRMRQDGSAAASVDEAVARLRERAGESLFIFLHLFDPHWDYTPPPPWAGLALPGVTTGRLVELRPLFDPAVEMPPPELRRLRSLYDAEIASVDHALARLLASLRHFRGGGEIVVAVTSDHGEEFKDHDSLGHGFTLYEEQLRVPFLITSDGPAEIVDTPASLLDVAPRLLARLGLDPPPTWRGTARPVPDRPLLAETRLFHRDLTASVTGEVKVVAQHGDRPRLEEFHLDVDPRELEAIPTTAGRGAIWLREAFEPGLHHLTAHPPEGEPARRDPFLPEVWDHRTPPGDPPTDPRPPWEHLDRSRLVAQNGTEETLVIAQPDEPELEAEQQELLRELGYLE